MPNTELLYKIGLTMVPGIGDILAKNLIAYCGSAEAVFKEQKSKLLRIPGLGNVTAQSVIESKVLKRAEEEIKFIELNKIQPLFFTDENYPSRLKHCSDSPVMLYYKGTANLNADKIVSVVGTRNPTEYGKKNTEALIAKMKEHNILVVSGLAYGIDVYAHKLSLQVGLDTVGVIAHGHDRIYPLANYDVAQKMKTQGGILTDFISGTNPDAQNFPKRNRIVAGICDALIVIESKPEGGSIITAEIANSYSRDVFAFPGKISDNFSGGCNRLIKRNKAALLESFDDVLYIMGWEKKEEKNKKKSAQIPLLLNLTNEEQKIISILQAKEKSHIDEICSQADLPVSKASALLLQLEFSNLVRSLPGKLYAIY